MHDKHLLETLLINYSVFQDSYKCQNTKYFEGFLHVGPAPSKLADAVDNQHVGDRFDTQCCFCFGLGNSSLYF